MTFPVLLFHCCCSCRLSRLSVVWIALMQEAKFTQTKFGFRSMLIFPFFRRRP